MESHQRKQWLPFS